VFWIVLCEVVIAIKQARNRRKAAVIRKHHVCMEYSTEAYTAGVKNIGRFLMLTYNKYLIGSGLVMNVKQVQISGCHPPSKM
jgi:hypothetical protein